MKSIATCCTRFAAISNPAKRSAPRLAKYGDPFDAVMVNQIKVGEHSARWAKRSRRIARHCEDGHRLKSEIVSKLAYPIILVCHGRAVITFLLTYVIPVFKKTYDDAHVTLPFITKVLIAVGALRRATD